MEIDAAREEYQKKVLKAKKIIDRMNKGKKIIEEKINNSEINSAFEGMRLYSALSIQLFQTLEECTLLHEHLAFGKKILLKRTGEAVNVKEMFAQAGEKVEISPWELNSLQVLERIFGEDLKNIVEFADTPSNE